MKRVLFDCSHQTHRTFELITGLVSYNQCLTVITISTWNGGESQPIQAHVRWTAINRLNLDELEVTFQWIISNPVIIHGVVNMNWNRNACIDFGKESVLELRLKQFVPALHKCCFFYEKNSMEQLREFQYVVYYVLCFCDEFVPNIHQASQQSHLIFIISRVSFFISSIYFL